MFWTAWSGPPSPTHASPLTIVHTAAPRAVILQAKHTTIKKGKTQYDISFWKNDPLLFLHASNTANIAIVVRVATARSTPGTIQSQLSVCSTA